jgi:hypothetical protein
LAANDYRLVSRWRVLGSIEEIYDLTSHVEELPRWWPAMFLEALPIPSGDEEGFAKVTRLESRGWLPYIHRWHTRVEHAEQPYGFTMQVWGDFKGRIVWRFAQHDAWADVILEWDVAARKPIERYLSVFFKPLFAASLQWGLARGEESLRLELARRHMDEPERSMLAAPPPPAGFPAVPLLAACGFAFGLLLLRKGRR